MNFQDKWATDESGEEFLFTVEMQRRLHEAGLPVEPSSLSELEGQAPRKTGGGSRQSSPSTSSSRSQPQEVEGPLTIQIDPQTGKYIGRVKWYNTRKGYGFIIRGGGEEIFFHKTGTVLDPEQLKDGQWVLYDVEHTKKGPEANEVEVYQGQAPE
jgi:CspA family cold shock protein